MAFFGGPLPSQKLILNTSANEKTADLKIVGSPQPPDSAAWDYEINIIVFIIHC